MMFKNPANGYTEKGYGALTWLWVLLFGPLYWAVKGVWSHFIAHILLSLATLGVAHFVYPFFTYSILRGHYGKKGWEMVILKTEVSDAV